MEVKTRAELAIELKRLRDVGYRYIARDEHSSYIKVFGLKPIKSKTKKPIWVYVNEHEPGALTVKEIHCEAATEIRFGNQKPTEITEWLKVYAR